jgi:hypothetical protein
MKIKTLVTVASALITCASAQAAVVGNSTSVIQLESGGNQDFVVKRLSMAGDSEEDLNQGMQIAYQGDKAAIAEMMADGKITFFDVGTKLFPVKSEGFLAQMWQVREKGSSDIWWVSIKAFIAKDGS